MLCARFSNVVDYSAHTAVNVPAISSPMNVHNVACSTADAEMSSAAINPYVLQSHVAQRMRESFFKHKPSGSDASDQPAGIVTFAVVMPAQEDSHATCKLSIATAGSAGRTCAHEAKSNSTRTVGTHLITIIAGELPFKDCEKPLDT